MVLKTIFGVISILFHFGRIVVSTKKEVFDLEIRLVFQGLWTLESIYITTVDDYLQGAMLFDRSRQALHLILSIIIGVAK